MQERLMSAMESSQANYVASENSFLTQVDMSHRVGREMAKGEALPP